jgi:4-hydroxy-3-polyprenylbenzoate decarboxylase
VSLDNISQFLSAIDRAGEMVRIKEPVRARLELCEIADRVMKQAGGGKALYFEHVILDNGERSQYPVVINLFGSMRRMSLALGVDDLDDVGGRITEMLDLKVPEGVMGKLSMLPRLLELGKFPPRVKAGKPPCQEIVLKGDEVDLSRTADRTSRCRW